MGVIGSFFEGCKPGPPYPYSEAQGLLFTISLFSPEFGLEKKFVLPAF